MLPFLTSEIDISDPAALKASFEKHFGQDESYEVISSDEGHCFPDGSYIFICTNYAAQVYRELAVAGQSSLSCKIMGFASKDNPSSMFAKERGDGHDFAIVQERFIVDGWIKLIDGRSNRVVFDMADPADASEIQRIYGDVGKFKHLHEFERAIVAKALTVNTAGQRMRVVA